MTSSVPLRRAGLAGLVLGLGAELLARFGQGLLGAGADLAVGWTLIGCGLLGWSRRPQSGVSPLLVFTGFALGLALQEAQRLPGETTAKRLEAAKGDLAEAQADLRELAAGIHPAMLTERGLGPALASLAERAPVPVRLAAPRGRLPAVIETAVYFVCSEALANVAKHARATCVDIQVRSEGER